MSLLLEALKKAEKAKEEAQRRARGDPADAPSAAPAAAPAAPRAVAPQPDLAPQAAAAPDEEARRVLTRAELPDISPSLRIASEDLEPQAPPSREELRLEPVQDPAARRGPAFPPAGAAGASAAAQAAEREAQRNSARRVFEAKFKEPDPKLWFNVTLGALGVFAAGIVVYFWYQLRPPPPLFYANPPRPPNEMQVAAAPEAPAAGAPAAVPTVIPGLPANLPATPLQPAAPAAIPPAAPKPSSAPPEKPLLSPAPRLAAPSVNAPATRPGAPAAPTLTVSRAAPQVHPKVDAGYAAYQAGDLAKARGEYEQVLAEDPANRDALLGLAAIDTRGGRYEAAEAGYLRLLQLDPRDAHAHAGLLALRSARLDPLVAESRVKTLLAQDPGSHVLNFTLGNQLAQQGRWAEAQQEYFKAFSGDPENADFAYNLAVSLDHLRQGRLAREYYLRAVALAERRGATFDPASARARAAALAN